jgi:hypothetical protein
MLAELMGADTDSERAIRWLILLIGAVRPAGHCADNCGLRRDAKTWTFRPPFARRAAARRGLSRIDN